MKSRKTQKKQKRKSKIPSKIADSKIEVFNEILIF